MFQAALRGRAKVDSVTGFEDFEVPHAKRVHGERTALLGTEN